MVDLAFSIVVIRAGQWVLTNRNEPGVLFPVEPKGSVTHVLTDGTFEEFVAFHCRTHAI